VLTSLVAVGMGLTVSALVESQDRATAPLRRAAGQAAAAAAGPDRRHGAQAM
jgi:hypothetical protein